MSHPHVTEKLALWVGGDLTEQEALSVQAHLDNCPACRSEASAYREAMSGLRTQPVLPFTEAERAAMRLEVMTKVRALGAPKPKRTMPWLLAAAASIPALMLFHALYAAKEKPAPVAVMAAVQSNPLEAAQKARPAAYETSKPTDTLVKNASPVPAMRRKRTANAAVMVAQSSVTRIEFQTENPNIRIIWFTNAGATTNATTKLDSATTVIKGDSNESFG